MGLPRRDMARYTYGDYRRWPEEARYELIDGAAYAMTPAPSRRHQEILGELFRQVANALEGKTCRAFIAPFEVRLPLEDEPNDEVETVVQPDLSVVCDPAKLDEQGCRGAPDWIVEVLSPATAGHDHILKRSVYERSGVREYWLVHPVDRIVTVFRLDEAGRYGIPEISELTGSLRVGALPFLEIDWDGFKPIFSQ